MRKHKQTGALGEDIAASYLVGKGYHILERNFRHVHKEVDIIASHGNELVFIEVKTRTNFDYGYPEEAVTLQKQNFLKAAATAYFEAHNLDMILRFDVIAIVMNNGKASELRHFEDAFY